MDAMMAGGKKQEAQGDGDFMADLQALLDKYGMTVDDLAEALSKQGPEPEKGAEGMLRMQGE